MLNSRQQELKGCHPLNFGWSSTDGATWMTLFGDPRMAVSLSFVIQRAVVWDLRCRFVTGANIPLPPISLGVEMHLHN